MPQPATDLPWIDEVKRTGLLSVHAGPGATGGPWATALSDAIREFNALAYSNGIGVQFMVTNDPPDPNTPRGANILFEATNAKSVSYTANGQTFPHTLDFGKHDLVHGWTFKVALPSRRNPQSLQVSKAFIYVPKTPLVSKPDGSQREVGPPIKLVMAVHEFIHACGLSEHSTLDNADVFFDALNPQRGNRPADDRIQAAARNGRLMPPIHLSNETAGRLRGLWGLSRDLIKQMMQTVKGLS